MFKSGAEGQQALDQVWPYLMEEGITAYMIPTNEDKTEWAATMIWPSKEALDTYTQNKKDKLLEIMKPALAGAPLFDDVNPIHNV